MVTGNLGERKRPGQSPKQGWRKRNRREEKRQFLSKERGREREDCRLRKGKTSFLIRESK